MALMRCAIHETRSVADPPACVSVQDQVTLAAASWISRVWVS